jgi:hypothetical protein
VSVLHVSPACNRDFEAVTSPELKELGDSALSIWKRLAKPCDRFVSVNTEDLFGRFSADDMPRMAEWSEYVHTRYPWIQQNGNVR